MTTFIIFQLLFSALINYLILRKIKSLYKAEIEHCEGIIDIMSEEIGSLKIKLAKAITEK